MVNENCLGSSRLEALVIYSIFKRDACPGVNYLIAEEKEGLDRHYKPLLKSKTKL